MRSMARTESGRQKVLIIGAGVAGMVSAPALAEIPLDSAVPERGSRSQLNQMAEGPSYLGLRGNARPATR
jgi:2-polyprenyl-6-methoxyphenol hydroxylase-like FAD-dependent oxidoreductase